MPADNAYVLTPADVRNIRAYVQSKYAAMPHEKRAEIVADAVKRIIHKQLPEFEPAIKRQLTHALTRTTVLEKQRPVCADDIYVLCMELDQSDEKIAKPLQSWVRSQENVLNHEGSIDESLRALVIPLPIATDAFIRKNKNKKQYLYSILSLCLITVSLLFGWSLTLDGDRRSAILEKNMDLQPEPLTVLAETSLNGLPSELRYEQVNKERLVGYLDGKGSILAEPHYLDAILQTAKEFDIHPAFLFAITGQEQAFVPKTHEKAEQIANNPFNVFHSWQDFNTTIDESAQIAARTIVRLSKDRPHDVDPFTWINREYAEDPNWSNGVRAIFTAIMKELKSPQEGK